MEKWAEMQNKKKEAVKKQTSTFTTTTITATTTTTASTPATIPTISNFINSNTNANTSTLTSNIETFNDSLNKKIVETNLNEVIRWLIASKQKNTFFFSLSLSVCIFLIILCSIN